MKLLIQLADRLQELSDRLHQHGNHNIELGLNRIRGAWVFNHNSKPKPTP